MNLSQQHFMQAEPCEGLEKGTGRQEQDKVKPWEEEEKLDQEGEEHHQRKKSSSLGAAETVQRGTEQGTAKSSVPFINGRYREKHPKQPWDSRGWGRGVQPHLVRGTGLH